MAFSNILTMLCCIQCVIHYCVTICLIHFCFVFRFLILFYDCFVATVTVFISLAKHSIKTIGDVTESYPFKILHFTRLPYLLSFRFFMRFFYMFASYCPFYSAATIVIFCSLLHLHNL